jgi:hypothetical protein
LSEEQREYADSCYRKQLAAEAERDAERKARKATEELNVERAVRERSNLEAVAESERARAVAAEADAARLREALDSFVKAYPESVFPEYGPGELGEAIAAIKGAGVSSERLHASWARHIVASIYRLAEGNTP